MDRRDFLALSTFFTGVALTPSIFGKAIAAEQLQDAIDIAVKKRLADAALGAQRHGLAVAQVGQVGGVARQAVDLRQRGRQGLQEQRCRKGGQGGAAPTGVENRHAPYDAAFR
mgnify:CR=1 FL=1